MQEAMNLIFSAEVTQYIMLQIFENDTISVVFMFFSSPSKLKMY